MHQPHPIDIAAKASGEPVFREVGVGPWAETHPGEPRPDDPQSVNYDRRFDSSLLDEGDRRNVLDQYRYWAVAAIKADLDARGRHDFEVAVENWTHDFNIGSMVRTANAFQAKRVHIVGPHKWNRKGSLMTELYQHVENHPSITELVECWKLRIAGEICRWHHERWDGHGYPDGLIGEQIPIAAQVVALADVYDALVSKRVYKDAYSHEQAMKMILNGECGAFNPLLMEVLVEIQDKIKEEIRYEA